MILGIPGTVFWPCACGIAIALSLCVLRRLRHERPHSTFITDSHTDVGFDRLARRYGISPDRAHTLIPFRYGTSVDSDKGDLLFLFLYGPPYAKEKPRRFRVIAKNGFTVFLGPQDRLVYAIKVHGLDPVSQAALATERTAGFLRSFTDEKPGDERMEHFAVIADLLQEYAHGALSSAQNGPVPTPA